jgi:hypothetical protein
LWRSIFIIKEFEVTKVPRVLRVKTNYLKGKCKNKLFSDVLVGYIEEIQGRALRNSPVGYFSKGARLQGRTTESLRENLCATLWYSV